jgi:hypothetical protein
MTCSRKVNLLEKFKILYKCVNHIINSKLKQKKIVRKQKPPKNFKIWSKTHSETLLKN